jgi:hypothetical protein
MEGVFIFKTQVYQNLEMRFTPILNTHLISRISFIKVFSKLLLLFPKIEEIGRIPIWYYSCL